MRLAAREDVEAPAAAVFAGLQDYDMFERLAVRRGAEVQRGGTAIRPEWTVAFDFRGKRREISVHQTVSKPPVRLVLRYGGALFEGEVTIDLVALARRRTRVSVTLDVRPLTLPARLLLQSAQVTRARLVQRLQTRITELARHLETAAGGGDGAV